MLAISKSNKTIALELQLSNNELRRTPEKRPKKTELTSLLLTANLLLICVWRNSNQALTRYLFRILASRTPSCGSGNTTHGSCQETSMFGISRLLKVAVSKAGRSVAVERPRVVGQGNLLERQQDSPSPLPDTFTKK